MCCDVSVIVSLRSYSCTVKMSLFSSIPEDQLEVLLVIFDYLDVEDLRRCEAVCHPWRKVLLAGKPWKRLFHRQIVSSLWWRQVGRNLVLDENELQTAHYRSLCRAIIRKLKPHENWRFGNFKKIEKVDSLQVVPVQSMCFIDRSQKIPS
jgi:F-box-like